MLFMFITPLSFYGSQPEVFNPGLMLEAGQVSWIKHVSKRHQIVKTVYIHLSLGRCRGRFEMKGKHIFGDEIHVMYVYLMLFMAIYHRCSLQPILFLFIARHPWIHGYHINPSGNSQMEEAAQHGNPPQIWHLRIMCHNVFIVIY
jgi:hypothetical protein